MIKILPKYFRKEIDSYKLDVVCKVESEQDILDIYSALDKKGFQLNDEFETNKEFIEDSRERGYFDEITDKSYIYFKRGRVCIVDLSFDLYEWEINLTKEEMIEFIEDLETNE